MAPLQTLTKWVLSYRFAILSAALLAGIIVLAGNSGSGLENDLRTMRDSIRSYPASGEIVIVEIDAQSIAEIDQWPWPRSVHGELVQRLSDAGVATVAFDVDFSSHSGAAEDQAFAEALQDARSLVVLPAFRQFAGSGSNRFVDSEPIEALRENSFLASVNIQTDSNGSVRRALMGVYTDDLPRPSLAAMLSETQGRANSDFPIDFAIDPATIPRVSYVDIVRDRIDLVDLEGRTVLVGATAIEMGDRYPVPGHGVVPGVIIQALAAETLMANGIPKEQGPELAILIALFGIAALLLPGPRSLRAAAAGTSMAVVILLPLATESFAATTYAIVPAAIMLGAAGLASVAAMAIQKYHHTLLIDRQSGMPNRAALLRAARGKGSLGLVVGKIHGFNELAALFPGDDIGDYFAELSRRLAGLDGNQVFRVDDACVAWFACEHNEREIEDHLEAISSMLRLPISVHGQSVDTSMAFGLANGEASEIASHVSGALFAAEQAVELGHRWERYVEGDREQGKWNRALQSELDEAMAAGDLWVAFQPKVSLETTAISGAESLIRWQHPVRGAIPPDSFIPLLEKRGRIAGLTLYVLDCSLEAAAYWQSMGQDIVVAVNVSAVLIDDRSFIDAMLAKFDRAKSSIAGLTVEITESAALENPERAIDAMLELQRHGIKISVDDYGTGQSTLSYLKELPASEIKIDQSFVQNILNNRSDQILVRSTIELAHELGLGVVAEGIEDSETQDLLASMGCDTGQGYLLGKPMSLADFNSYARESSKKLSQQTRAA